MVKIFKSVVVYILEMNSKKQLAVILSRLSVFQKPSARLEQYPTDSEIAAEVLWFADMNGDIKGKKIADLGCGTGILGIGCLQFIPEKVYFVDIDKYALKQLEENLKLMELKGEIYNKDVRDFSQEVDVIFQNPPFGVQSEHADKIFLEQAFKLAKVVYSFHKIESDSFIDKLSKEKGFKVTHFFKFDFPLKKTQDFHTKKRYDVKVGCWRIEKQL